MVRATSKGDFTKTIDYLKNLEFNMSEEMLNKYGMEGKNALIEATPVKSGLTASLWSYDITTKGSKQIISWNNDNLQNGINIAIVIDNGYVTKKGFRVPGRKFIEKAMEPVFKEIEEEVFKEAGR
jgi:hypothetical protein